MPFTGESVLDKKREFVRLARQPDSNVRALCRSYGISPTTGYTLLARHAAQGDAGLEPRSRRPHTSPTRTQEDLEKEVLAVRAAHPAWGGRKIAAVLKRKGLTPPAASTITAILKRHGVAMTEGTGQAAFTRFEHPHPNALWQMDFKGHVAMVTGRLHPLTVLDDHSRYNIVLGACGDERTRTVKDQLINAFRRYGLPERIVTDNGSPWGNSARDRYTPLGVWLIEQDIRIGHSRPLHPQTLGKDERFHRSLKAEALAGPPFADLGTAAEALARWRGVYNLERPHEALGMVPPVERYTPSPRAYAETPAPFEYGPGDRTRRVQQGGRISFEGRTLRVPKAFRGKEVALRPTDTEGCFNVFFRRQHIITVDLDTGADP